MILRLTILCLLFSLCTAQEIMTVTYSDSACKVNTTVLTVPNNVCQYMDGYYIVNSLYQGSLVNQCVHKLPGCTDATSSCTQYLFDTCVLFPYAGTGNRTMAFYVVTTTTSSASLTLSFPLVSLVVGYAIHLLVL